MNGEDHGRCTVISGQDSEMIPASAPSRTRGYFGNASELADGHRGGSLLFVATIAFSLWLGLEGGSEGPTYEIHFEQSVAA